MFVDTKIAILNDQALKGVVESEKCGIDPTEHIEPENFLYRMFRFNIGDLKYYHQSRFHGLLNVKLYDEEQDFVIRDSMVRLNQLVDEYYKDRR